MVACHPRGRSTTSGKAAKARPHYEAEGVPLQPSDDEDGYRIDLAVSRWRP